MTKITIDLYQALLVHKMNQIRAQDMLTSYEKLKSVYPDADIHCAEAITGPINILKKDNIYLGTAFDSREDIIYEIPFISDPIRAEEMDYSPLEDIFDDLRERFNEAFKGCGYELRRDTLLVDDFEIPRFDFVCLADGNRYDYSTATTLSSRLEMLKGMEGHKA